MLELLVSSLASSQVTSWRGMMTDNWGGSEAETDVLRPFGCGKGDDMSGRPFLEA